MRYSALSTLVLAASASALYNDCPVSGEYCIQIGAPEDTISRNTGNLYIQLQAKSSYSWIALGQGNCITGANIFLVYADGSDNVTVSTRSGVGHTQPKSQIETRVSLLEGSGVSDGIMTANLVCENCDTWDSGTMELGANSTEWITAWKEGDVINSTSQDASITQHDGTQSHQIDLSSSSIDSDSNPFLTARGALASDSRSTTTTTSNTANNGSGSSFGLGTGSNSSGSGSRSTDLFKIHGYVMGAMFVILYPIGTILMPALHKWALHAFVQVLAVIGMWIGFGLGHKAASQAGILYNDPHQIIGILVCAAMMLQPIFGYAHHRYFVRNKCRSMISYLHIWYGRMLIGLGVINGGLGLTMFNASNDAIAAYAILAGIWGVIYAGISSLSELKRDLVMRRSRKAKDIP